MNVFQFFILYAVLYAYICDEVTCAKGVVSTERSLCSF